MTLRGFFRLTVTSLCKGYYILPEKIRCERCDFLKIQVFIFTSYFLGVWGKYEQFIFTPTYGHFYPELCFCYFSHN